MLKMTSTILKIEPLGSPWKTIDPFLICAYHVDNYPSGNDDLGPDTAHPISSMDGDSDGTANWSMYYGRKVPGFPAHPHRGFETITILRKGVVDHADSMGNSARYAAGDVQWLTAGRGINHSEMFPLLNREAPNPLELFQIWLNLPARSKMVTPNFKMLWAENIPLHQIQDKIGCVEIRCIVGSPGEEFPQSPPTPPNDSWASAPNSDLAIWTIKLSPHAKWTLPPASGSGTRRQLFYFMGEGMLMGGHQVDALTSVEVSCDEPMELINGSEVSELLMLQGRPIGELVIQDGPFVMNSTYEISQAYEDYRQTQFGGWGWPSKDPVHDRDRSRFESR
ncbi:pirin [Janthinobacterium lividum]|nr:pirin [Janthinobacterium lividum]